ncbi:MAG: sigma-54 interaction domain-containing protein [Myxococcota bacterium]
MSADLKQLDALLRRVGVAEAFTALAGLVPDAAVVVLDAGERVLFWSGEAERLLGWRREDVLGRPCPADTRAGGDALFGEVVRARRADGTAVQVRCYERRFHDAAGERVGSVHLLVHAAATPEARALAMPDDAVTFHGLVSRDPAMLRVFDMVRNVAETDATVLVRGESGTGKELVARAIHLESHRRGQPFVAVNCAAFTQTLLESELFGHVKGAFTGAVGARAGIFAQADGGTLFLDEVAELPLETQAKLLRVLQERTFVPVGGTEPVRVDVRIVAATHRALRQEARAGRFREDLLYRLRVVPIFVPALRERRLDVDLLLRHFVDAFNTRGPRRVSRVSPEAMRALLDYPWPGNVRELQNLVEYVFAVGRGEEITLAELPPEIRELREARAAADAAPRAREPEPDRVRRALAEADGDLARAAELLGVSRTTFWRMRRKTLGA